MKKRILWAFGLFMVFQFFAMADSIFAESCGDGGTCKCSNDTWVTCGADDKIAIGANDCTTSSLPTCICCKAKATTTTTTGTNGNTTTGTSGTPSTINFANPLAFDTVEELLAKVMTTFQGMIVVLCLIFFIWAAIVYITSAGNEERVKSAKSGMTASLIGLALGIAAPSILKTISDILEWNKESAQLTGALSFSQIALNVLEFLLGAVGVLGIIMLIVGGIMYFGSAADEKNVEAAKKTIKYAIIGIALALGSMVIVRQIAALLT